MPLCKGHGVVPRLHVPSFPGDAFVEGPVKGVGPVFPGVFAPWDAFGKIYVRMGLPCRIFAGYFIGTARHF